MSITLPHLQARGLDLDTGPEAFGFLRVSTDIQDNGAACAARLADEGYLYLPGLLHRPDVDEARRFALAGLADQGFLDPDADLMTGRMKPGAGNPYFKPDLVDGNTALRRVLYEEDGPLMRFFRTMFGEPVRHFDFTWFRAVGPGKGTAPHCDVVYMGRGTSRLITAWTPLGDIPLEIGGLMVLENSHKRTDVTGTYLQQDVDSYCENGANRESVTTGKLHWEDWKRWQETQTGNAWDGSLSHDPVALREQLGGRWLTAREYCMGDVLLFTMGTVHASIDNQTLYIRLSTDTRYQRASESIDERWINGENNAAPMGHSLAGKRGRVC